jgi:hypothetical protein
LAIRVERRLPHGNLTERRTHILVTNGDATYLNRADGGREGPPLIRAEDDVGGGNVGLELADLEAPGDYNHRIGPMAQAREIAAVLGIFRNGALGSRATPPRPDRLVWKIEPAIFVQDG